MKESFTRFYKYRFLLENLIQRDLKVKYRRSNLGILWSVLNPLLMMLVMTAVFQFMFRFDIENYPVYLLSGQILFTFFNEASSSAMGSVLFSSSLIKKVYVPKYIFPIEKCCFAFINLLFSGIALIFVMLITGTKITFSFIYAIIPLVTLFIFATGVGLLLAAGAVFFRDVMHFWSVFIMALTYLTPIFYPIEQLPLIMQKLQFFNPMFSYVNTFRTCVLYGNAPSFMQVMQCVGFALIALALGVYVFRKKQDDFILYI